MDYELMMNGNVKIGQIGLYNKALSYSNVYNISKLDN